MPRYHRWKSKTCLDIPQLGLYNLKRAYGPNIGKSIGFIILLKIGIDISILMLFKGNISTVIHFFSNVNNLAYVYVSRLNYICKYEHMCMFKHFHMCMHITLTSISFKTWAMGSNSSRERYPSPSRSCCRKMTTPSKPTSLNNFDGM